jgi:hypothetical protein
LFSLLDTYFVVVLRALLVAWREEKGSGMETSQVMLELEYEDSFSESWILFVSSFQSWILFLLY